MNPDYRDCLKTHICENEWYVRNQPHWRHAYSLVQEMYEHCIYAKVSLLTKKKTESLEPGLVMSHDRNVRNVVA